MEPLQKGYKKVNVIKNFDFIEALEQIWERQTG